MNAGSPGGKAAATRARILDAAASVFRTKGYKEATLSDIAGAAEVKAGSLYYHFASREDLVAAFLEATLAEILEFVRRHATDTAVLPPLEHVREEMADQLSVLLGKRDYIPAFLRIMDQLPENLRDPVVVAGKEYSSHLRAGLRRVQEAGEIRPDLDLSVCRMFLIGAANSTADWFRPRKKGIGLAELQQTFAAVFLEGLAGGFAVERLAPVEDVPERRSRPVEASQDDDGGSTRQRILDAAARVFVRDSYATGRLADIAAEAGIQTGSLYYYFKSREELVSDLLETSAERIHRFVQDQVADLRQDASMVEHLATMIRAQVVCMLTNDYTPAMMRIRRQVPASERARSEAAQRRYVADWVKTVERGMDAGEFRADVDAAVVCRLIFGAINHTASWYTPRGPVGPEGIGQQLTTLVVGGLVQKRPTTSAGSSPDDLADVRLRLSRVEAQLAELVDAVASLNALVRRAAQGSRAEPSAPGNGVT